MPSNTMITLRAARVNCGFTLKDVASVTNKSPETISKYEVDSANIPRDLMVQLVELYQVPNENIFFGRESSFHGLKRQEYLDHMHSSGKVGQSELHNILVR